MPRGDFVHLHLHTQYSLLDGAIRISDAVVKAKDYKMPALAITDHGNLFGAMEFYTVVQASGIKPIIGCEVYVAPGSRFTHSTRPGEPHSHHLILLCENEKGYRNLCRLVTKGHQEGFYYKPRVDAELLEEFNEGLVCLSSCMSGEIGVRILAGDEKGAEDKAAWYRGVFDDGRYFLEIQENGLENQRKVNQGILQLSKRLNIPLVATNDCHYLEKSDHRAHEILLCIQTGKKIDDPGRLIFDTDQFYFKSPEQMAHDFREVPEALRNTLAISERCSLLLEFGQLHMPRFDLGTGETLRERLEKDARDGLEQRINRLLQSGNIDPIGEQEYRKRLDHEILLIQEMGFSGYLLIVADFIRFARANRIPVGPGRGSAAGSLVAYCLGITDIDPIRYKLLFERFLNPERRSMPDIDVDFCTEGRERVIEYVSRKYGKDNVAQIITFGRMQAKAVVRDVARVMGLPYADADKIAKLIPDALRITLDTAIKEEPRLREMIERSPDVGDLINAARSLEGLTRHASTHAAGIVISDRPLVEHLPLYVGNNKETVTQYDMTWVEKIGLVKFDFLGLKTLTVIDQAVRLIEKSRGIELDMGSIPLDDRETFELLSKGDTLAIFQLESSGMRDVLTKFKPSVFEDLIAILALYRPGPLESGMVDDFINRKHGRTPIEYHLPELEPILKETYGVIVYQEQVMNIATALADYTMGEADLLRRAMGKKKASEMAEQKSRFEKGAARNKLDPEKAAHIFELMEKFAGYGFNKSHSAAYAMVTYQTAFLKTHYKPEFMAAQLSCESGNTDKIKVYISECREMGIEILPPHVNQSVEGFQVVDGKIVFGLGALKNVGEGAVGSILDAREKAGLFCSLQDFVRRVDLRKANKKVLESLIKCGAFDGIGPSRRAMIDAMDSVLEQGAGFQREQNEGQFNLFSMECVAGETGNLTDFSIPKLPEWEDLTKLSFEKEILGFYVTGHPLMNYEDLIGKFAGVFSSTLSELPPSAPVKMAGLVKSLKEITTRKGDRMAFVMLEDMTGSTEITVFSDLYQKSRDLLESGEPLVVAGVRNGDTDAPKVLANEIHRLQEAPRHFSKGLRIRISTPGADPFQIKDLKRILSRHKGRLPVKINVVIPNRSETVINLPSTTCDASEAMLAEVYNTFGYQAVTFE
ncbi:MAG: DNA polymerase III subunit alpha [Deltaproteobacteria bacterium]|nr:DNA polymerase III subunit alpha [Deltaproteobacteria bacterium]